MKIFLIGPANSIHMLKWANGLAERKHDVYLYSCHNPLVGYKDTVTIIKSIYLAPLGYILNSFHLRRVISQICPDIINVHYATGYGTLSSLSRMNGKYPVLLSVWGSDVYDFPYKSSLHKLLLKYNLLSAHKVASTSHCMAKQTNIVVPEINDIIITPFGVDLLSFSKDKDKDKDKDNHGYDKQDKIIIGTVKTMSHKYGVDTLIEAFALLKNKIKKDSYDCELELRLVGGGNELHALTELAERLGISDSVTFVGQVSHEKVPYELEAIDIYVALSRLDSESFGVAIIEASAAGKPVIVSNVGGLPEVTINGKTGFVVPKENPKLAASAIERLVLDAELRHRLGINGRKHVEHNYAWDHCVSVMIDAYNRCIEKFNEK